MVEQRILALTGPAGSGKTATVKVLARELGFELIEWRNSMGDAYGGASSFIGPSFTDFDHRIPLDLDAIPQLDKFQAFLTLVSMSRSVFGRSSSRPCVRQVILLEDLPNILHADSREKFHDALRLFVQRQTSQNGEYVPLVIIMSDVGARGEVDDTGGSNSFRGRKEALEIRSALPADLLSTPHVAQIR